MSNDTFVSPLDLGADLLDYYVAKAVGITPIGYAMCRPCPESATTRSGMRVRSWPA